MKRLILIDPLGKIQNAQLSGEKTLGELVSECFVAGSLYESLKYKYELDRQTAQWVSIVTEDNTTISVTFSG